MVKVTTIKQCNARFASEHHAGLVCVFAGATSGIGASTPEKMVAMLDKSIFYVLGRSAARFEAQHSKLRSLNSSCKIVFVEVEVSLLSAVDIACKQIIAAEQKVDYLYMSPGLVPLNGLMCSIDTKEGLELCFALSYYSRMRLLSNLLPLLHRSSQPRVLSVLNGGKEKPMYDDGIGLDNHWSTFAVVNHTTTMTSLAFEYLATNDKCITFLHTCPGLVRTDIFARLTPPEGSSFLWRVALASIRGVVAVAMLLIGISIEESGERHAFHLTNDTHTPGVWLIDPSSELVERGWPEKIWEYTEQIFAKALSMGDESLPR
ncbi:hypothetical protein BDV97DRAFT_415034 [Delphinella strobiligena]|nr:hypothetical protein BDV97DRAFT_415034 [Delphinella strobiligena]